MNNVFYMIISCKRMLRRRNCLVWKPFSMYNAEWKRFMYLRQGIHVEQYSMWR